MNAFNITGGIILIIVSILLVIFVFAQETKQPGMSAFTGEVDSYYSKNKGRTLEAKLVSVTRTLLIIFFVLAIAMNIVLRYVK